MKDIYTHAKARFRLVQKTRGVDHLQNAINIFELLCTVMPNETRDIMYGVLDTSIGDERYGMHFLAARDILLDRKNVQEFTFETANGVKITVSGKDEAEAREKLTADLRLVSGG